MKIIKKNDILLLAALLFVGAILLLAFNFTKNDGGSVDVFVDGKKVVTYALGSDRAVDLDFNGHNKLVIKNGKAFVTEADCPDKLCTKQMKISKDGETIICLPHKTVIKASGGKESEYDGVLK